MWSCLISCSLTTSKVMQNCVAAQEVMHCRPVCDTELYKDVCVCVYIVFSVKFISFS